MITITPNPIRATVGSTFQFIVFIDLPGNDGGTLEVSSSDDAVVSFDVSEYPINANGDQVVEATAVAEGMATITATYTQDNGPVEDVTADVTVRESTSVEGLGGVIRAAQQWPGNSDAWNETGMIFPVEIYYSGDGNPPDDLVVYAQEDPDEDNHGVIEVLNNGGIVQFTGNIGYSRLTVRPTFNNLIDLETIHVKLFSYDVNDEEPGDEIPLVTDPFIIAKSNRFLRAPDIPAANNGPINDLDVRNGVDIIVFSGASGFVVGETIHIYFKSYEWQHIITSREAGAEFLSFPVQTFMLENGTGDCKYSLTSPAGNTSYSSVRYFAVNRTDLITNATLDEVEIQEAKNTGIINIASATAIPHAEFTNDFYNFVNENGTGRITVTLKGYTREGAEILGANIALAYDKDTNFARIVPLFASSEESVRFFNRIGLGQVGIRGTVDAGNSFFTSVREKHYLVDVIAPGNDEELG